MKKVLKGCLSCLGVLVVLFAAAILWGWMLGRAEDLGKQAHTEVLMPYLTALSEGRRREAYDKYTTAKFRQHHSFEDFDKAHQARPPADLQKFHAPGGGTSSTPIGGGARLHYTWYFQGEGDKGSQIVYYDVVKTPEGLRIDETWGTRAQQYVNTANGNRSSELKLVPEIW